MHTSKAPVYQLLAGERGAALVLALIAVVLIFISGSVITFGTINQRAFFKADESYHDAGAVAEAAVGAAIAYIDNLPSPIVGSDPILLLAEDGALDDCCGAGIHEIKDSDGNVIGSFDVVIDPRDSNSGSNQKSYLIRVIARYQGTTAASAASAVLGTGNAPILGTTPTTRTMEFIVVQDNFARYAYFSNDDKGSGGFWPADSIFTGPAHTNTAFRLRSGPASHSYGQGPVFEMEVTQVDDEVLHTSDSDEGMELFLGGLKTGVAPIPLPSDTSRLEKAAEEGIQLRGDTAITFFTVDETLDGGTETLGYALIDNKTLETANSTLPKLTVGSTTYVIWDLRDGWTQSKGFKAAGNLGVISVGGTSPVLRLQTAHFTRTDGSASTLATDIASSLAVSETTVRPGFTGQLTVASAGVILLEDDLIYYGYTPGDTSYSGSNVLGLVARQTVNGVENVWNGSSCGSGGQCDLNVSASIMSMTDAYEWDQCNSSGCDETGNANGYMRLFGGVITMRGGFWGIMSSSGGIASGYIENYLYDRRLLDTPPPFFPTTGTYSFLAARERTVPIPAVAGEVPNMY